METRTNIVLDDKLVAQAMRKAGVTTKKAAIEAALRAYVREPDWEALIELEGSQALAPDYDPSALFKAEASLGYACEPRAGYSAEGVTSKAGSSGTGKRRKRP
jgi:hypothetical protein